MKENKHTKGEWTIQEDYDKKYDQAILNINTQGIEGIATIWTAKDHASSEDWANARLIASAPILLAILRELVEDVQDEPISTSVNDTLRRANEIINKAIGE